MAGLTGAWEKAMEPEFSKPYYRKLFLKVGEEYRTHTVYPPAQDIFIIDIERRAVGLGQLARAVLAVKVEAVGISGTDIGHIHL